MPSYKSILALIFLLGSSFSAFSQTTEEGYYLDLIKTKLNNNDPQGAMNVLEIGMSELPESPYLLGELAGFLHATREYSSALLMTTKVIKLAGDDEQLKARMYELRGGTNFDTMRYEQALKDYQAALDIDPDNLDYLSNLAIALGELGKKEEAIVHLKRAVELDSTHVTAWTNIGYSLQALERYEESLIYLDKAVELDPKSGFSYSNRSYSRLMAGDTDGAMEDIELAIELIPTNSWAFKVKAMILLEKGKKRAACKALDEALELGYTKQYGDEVAKLKEENCK